MYYLLINLSFSKECASKNSNIILTFITDGKRICRKYLERGDPTFTVDEITKVLKGLDPKYATIQTWENWAQSGLVDIDENYNLTLNERGKEECRKKKLLL